MGKKLKIQPLNTTKSACESLSSNCVIWQGPTIPCLDICKGASISEVMYGIAIKFCEFYEQLDPEEYNLECLELDTCNTSFKDLIQAMITQICFLKAAGGCNVIVNIVPDEENPSTVFTADVDTNATSVVDYQWSFVLYAGGSYNITGNGTATVEVGIGGIDGEYSTGMLYVTVTDSNGCKANTSYLVNQK